MKKTPLEEALELKKYYEELKQKFPNVDVFDELITFADNKINEYKNDGK